MTQLTAHFSLEELCASDYALRHGINNVPTDPDIIENLTILAQGLERLRGLLLKPIHVNSGYRCPKLNSAVKGSKTSQHLQGLAADIVVPGMTTTLLARSIVAWGDTINYDQVIHEGTWVHLSFPDVDVSPRRQVLTAHFANGAVTYTQGLA